MTPIIHAPVTGRGAFQTGSRSKDGSWGYRLLVVDDLDGNQLFFNYPTEPAAGKIPAIG
jgi:hypothetical protein